MTTHDLLFLKNIGARCIVLNQGKIITDTMARQKHEGILSHGLSFR